MCHVIAISPPVSGSGVVKLTDLRVSVNDEAEGVGRMNSKIARALRHQGPKNCGVHALLVILFSDLVVADSYCGQPQG